MEVNINEVSDSNELLKALMTIDNSNYDKNMVAKYLEARKASPRRINFNYGNDVSFNVDSAYVKAQTGVPEESQISGVAKDYSRDELLSRGRYDYRITIRNSSDITNEEAIAFVSTFVAEARKRKLNLGAKNWWEIDAFIIYCDAEELYNTIMLLEDLKSKDGLVKSAINNFGNRQPFSVALSDSSYYGISMAHSELEYGEKRKTCIYPMGNPVNTFNGYIDDIFEKTYLSLMKKYNYNFNAITVDEFYEELIRQHKKYMFGSPDDNRQLPLWMNRRNYQGLFPTQIQNFEPKNRVLPKLFIWLLRGRGAHITTRSIGGDMASLLSTHSVGNSIPSSTSPSNSKSDEQLRMIADFLREHGLNEFNAESLEFIKNYQFGNGITISGDLSLYGIASSLTEGEIAKVNTMLLWQSPNLADSSFRKK